MAIDYTGIKQSRILVHAHTHGTTLCIHYIFTYHSLWQAKCLEHIHVARKHKNA